jgi:hypothetical protein
MNTLRLEDDIAPNINPVKPNEYLTKFSLLLKSFRNNENQTKV